MDRGQHLCTYPGSLPPQSITTQSIKSSKKTQKKRKGSKGMMLLPAALLLLFPPCVCQFNAGLIYRDTHLLIFTKQPVPRLFHFLLRLEQHVPIREALLLLKDDEFHHLC